MQTQHAILSNINIIIISSIIIMLCVSVCNNFMWITSF